MSDTKSVVVIWLLTACCFVVDVALGFVEGALAQLIFAPLLFLAGALATRATLEWCEDIAEDRAEARRALQQCDTDWDHA